MDMFYYDVLVSLPFDKLFTYSSPTKIEALTVVNIPFQNKQILGMVINEHQLEEAATSKGFKAIETITTLKLTEKFLSFLQFVASYNLIPLGQVFKMALPASELIHTNDDANEDTTAELYHHDLFTLSTNQQAAADQLINKLNKGFSVTVLDGITGSGKTEVFLKVIANIIIAKGQTLVLLPEIILTTQLIERFEQRLGGKPCQWHSKLAKAKRRKNFNSIISGQQNLVVGARSALLLPYKNLKLIVIDEEHDQSFKQEEGSIYNARDMAIVLAKFLDIPIILSSATPSIETLYNVKQHRYDVITLNERFSKVELPKIELIDTSKLKSTEFISLALKEAIASTLSMHKQILLFLNRRGFTPVTICRSCKTKISCKNCNSYLVQHKKISKLICHYCGYSAAIPKTCNNCNTPSDYAQVGLGVEKLEEEIQALFPQARILILSSDTLSTSKKVEAVLNKINNQEVDIIIGTQLITKGLHFKNLHLVGVIDADSSLIGGDIRAIERTYQLLQQVAGRAGREGERGLALVQSKSPNSLLMKNLQSGDRDAFVEVELANREIADMPPYSRLITINLSGKNELAVIEAIKILNSAAPRTLAGVKVIGPSPAPLFYLRNNYRYRFILIAEKNIAIQKIITTWLANAPISKQIKIKVDVDPYSFS